MTLVVTNNEMTETSLSRNIDNNKPACIRIQTATESLSRAGEDFRARLEIGLRKNVPD